MTKSKFGDVVEPCGQHGTIDIPLMPPYPQKGCDACNCRCACNVMSRVISRAAFEKLAAGLLPPAPEAVHESDHSPRTSTSEYDHVHVTCWRCDISSFQKTPATNRLLTAVTPLTRLNNKLDELSKPSRRLSSTFFVSLVSTLLGTFRLSLVRQHARCGFREMTGQTSK